MSNIDPATLSLHHAVDTCMHVAAGKHTQTLHGLVGLIMPVIFFTLTHTTNTNTHFLTVNLVDLRVLWQNLVGQFLCRGQHLRVVDWDQVLDELLQLVSAHLKQRLWDRQVQFDLLGLPYSVKRQRHYMGTVEDVLVAAGARYSCDLAAVKADAHAAHELRGRGCGGVRHCAAQMKTWKRSRNKIRVHFSLKGGGYNFISIINKLINRDKQLKNPWLQV